MIRNFYKTLALMLPLFLFSAGCGHKADIVTYPPVAVKAPVIFGELIITTLLRMPLQGIADHFAVKQQEDEGLEISYIDLAWNDAPPDIQKYCSEIKVNFSSHYQGGRLDPRARQVVITMKADRKDAPDLVKKVLSLFDVFEIQGDAYRQTLLAELAKGKEVRQPMTSGSLKGYVSFYGPPDKPRDFEAQVRFAEVGQFFPVSHQ